MKKNLFAILAVLSSIIALSISCSVDKDFDLTDIKTDNIVIGDTVTAPLANFDIKLGDLLNFGSRKSVITRAPELVDIPGTFSDTYNITHEYDQEIKKYLKDGALELHLTVTHEVDFPESMKVSVTFLSGDDRVEILKDLVVNGKNIPTSTSTDVSPQMLDKLIAATKAEVKFGTVSGNSYSDVMLDPDANINIKGYFVLIGGAHVDL